MLLDFHPPNLLLVPRARSRHRQPTPNLVSMVGMDRVENLPCLRSHTKDLTSKPHLVKDHSKDISRPNLKRKRKPALSRPHPTSSPRTIQLILSNETHTATTNSNTASKVRRPSRRAPPRSNVHIVDMALPKVKEPPSSHRAQLNSHSRGMPPLERVKLVATPRQTLLHRLSNLVQLRLPSLNQATPNNPRPQTTLTAILITRARTTPST